MSKLSKTSRGLFLFATLSMPIIQGCGGLARSFGAGRTQTVRTTAPTRAAPAPSVATSPAREVLAAFEAARLEGWNGTEPTDHDLRAFEPVSVPVEAGVCYVVLVILESQSTWPSNRPLSLTAGSRGTMSMSAYEPVRDAIDRSGRFDGEHPIGKFNHVCFATSETMTLAVDGTIPPSDTPARAIVRVLSRDIMEMHLQSVPEGWPEDFLVMPGRIDSQSTSSAGGRPSHLLVIDTLETSPEVADLFYRRMAERAGMRLQRESQSESGSSGTMFSRTFNRGQRSWQIDFRRQRRTSGELGTIRVSHYALGDR